ncbi:MAG: 3-hydroxybutyrate dehydrogenase [Hyphomicrobiaceae bacterium]
MTSPVDVSNRTAIVTGSTSGIGLATAKAFVEAGMSVVVNGRGKPDDVAPILAQLSASAGASGRSPSIHYIRADLREPGNVIALIDEARTKLGHIDILVNNAGIQHVAPIEEFPPEKWDDIIATNLSSAFHTIRSVMGEMKRRRFGRIINIASAHALVASPYKSAYIAAKHGLLGLTKSAALESAEHGVTVNAICPAYVLTPLVERQIPDTAKARGISEEEVVRTVLLPAQPTRQFVTVEQVAALALFLCSEAAASITGTALPVDGGWTAQ